MSLILLVLVALRLFHTVDLKEAARARVALPVKVVLGVAVATSVKTDLLASGTVSEGNMVISDVVKEVDLVFGQQETGGDRVDGSVTPSFVEETAVLVKGFEVVDVRLGSEPVEVTNFEVRPEMAVVIGVASIITQEAHGVALGNVLRVVLDELLGAVPKSRDGLDVLVQAQDEAVLLVILLHEAEGIVVNIAEELDRGLDTPVVVIAGEQRRSEEVSRVEATHIPVWDRMTIDNFLPNHLFT